MDPNRTNKKKKSADVIQVVEMKSDDFDQLGRSRPWEKRLQDGDSIIKRNRDIGREMENSLGRRSSLISCNRNMCV